MKIIANKDFYDLIDDGDYWLVRASKKDFPDKDKRILKTDEPFYPLQMILKWGFKTVDGDFIDKMTIEMTKQ